jgi:hypothetical protein
MSEFSHPYASLREARRNARQLTLDGELWLVYELPPSPFDRRMTASLVFESAQAMRRVRSFPSAWRDLTDEDLFALSWNV